MKKVIFILLLLTILLTLSACVPDSPSKYPSTAWVCETPYMYFEVQDDETGRWGIGQVEDENGELIDVKFAFVMTTCYIYKEEDVYSLIDEDGDKVLHTGNPIFSGINIKMKNHDKKMTLETSDYNNYEYDQLYHGKYKTLTFKRQD